MTDGPTTIDTDTETTHTTDMTRDRPTLGDMSHTNPYTGEVFGDTQTYSRGKTVAADGGEASDSGTRGHERPGQSSGDAGRRVSRPSSDAVSSDGGEADAVEGAEASEDDPERLKDVDHTPPGESDGAQAAYDRGNEDE